MGRHFRAARVVAVCAVVVVLGACTHAARDVAEDAPAAAAALAAQAPGPLEGEVVVAEVEHLERRAHEEWLDDGSVWVTDVVGFGIVAPQHLDTMLFVHVDGHPHVDGRPLLLGDAVTFVLPVNWRNRDLAFGDLEQLAFAR